MEAVSQSAIVAERGVILVRAMIEPMLALEEEGVAKLAANMDALVLMHTYPALAFRIVREPMQSDLGETEPDIAGN